MIAAPRLALWLLSRRLSGAWRDYVVGDLVEEFQKRAARSRATARLWFWGQTLRCLIAPPPSQPIASVSVRNRHRDSHMQTLFADLRYSARVLARTPSFTLAVVAVLALGIGANAAIFSIANSVLLRPLPFADPDRLVRVFHIPPQATFPGMARFSVSPANFYDWQRDATAFERMAIYQFRSLRLTGRGTPQTILAGAVGENFFEIVDAQPARGRIFRPDEDRPGREHVVIVSHGFWQRQLGGAEDVLAQTLTLDGSAYQIVGVMPASFSIESWGASGRDFWIPLAYDDEARLVRENHNAQVITRLKPGATIAQAQAELDVISKRLEQLHPKENAGWGATVIPLQELIVGDIRRTIVMLVVAVGLVLLIACANVSNLLFARGLARRKELAVRAAMGAGRARVFQHVLIEAVLLAVTGGALGLVIAQVTLRQAASILAGQLPRADEIALDPRVFAFVAAVSVVAGLLAGVVPAVRAGRTSLTDALKEGGRGDSSIGVRTRRLLIVCEVALSVVLLMGAGVMTRSLLAVRYADAGFDASRLLTMSIILPESKYETRDKTRAFFTRAVEDMRALPGVVAAAAIDSLPTQGGSVQPIVVEGRPELLPRDQPTVEVRRVTPGYFQSMRIPLLRGRDVSDSDVETLLVSQSAARLLWSDADPIGQRVTLPITSRTILREVVGVVGDVKQGRLEEAAAPTIYLYTRSEAWSGLTIVLRAHGEPLALAASARAVIRGLDADQPVEDVQTMDTVLNAGVASRRFSAIVLGLFAATALLLASVGIYSVLSHIVRGRSREIGIRTALGARTGDVLGLIVREGMAPALIGIAIGAVAALGSAKVIEGLVFGVSATDPLTLAAVAAALAIVAFAASLIPAWRASRLDPLKVLRT